MATHHSPLYVPRQRDDDEISMISMQELAPSPEDDSDYYMSSDDSPTPPQTPKSPPQYVPAPRGLPFWLTRTQKYSAYTFLTFLGVHTVTAAATPLLLPIDSANSSLLLARTYFYQATPVIEATLIPCALGIHIGSGLALRIHRHFAQKERYGGRVPVSASQWRWRNLSGISRAGLIAIPGVTLHAGLMRVLPMWVTGDSSAITLEYLGYGFWRGKWGWLVGTAFYGGFIAAMSYHVVYGWAGYLKVNPRRRKAVGAAAVGLAAVWAGGLTRIVSVGKVGGYVGRSFEELYRRVFQYIE